MRALTSAKFGALVGVLISVTTMAAAANAGRGDRLLGYGGRQSVRPFSW
jgi:hypothetical protein